jgi:hypothetical protein
MSKKKLIFVMLTVVATIAVTIPFISHAENIGFSRRKNPPTLNLRPVEEARANQREDEPQVLSLQVNPSGFEPGEAIVPQGRFLILLQNRTGRRDLTFWIARENRERVAESVPERRDWKAQVRLGPGTYVIGETNHPEWQFTLRVTN